MDKKITMKELVENAMKHTSKDLLKIPQTNDDIKSLEMVTKFVFKTDDNKYVIESGNGLYTVTEEFCLATLYFPNQLYRLDEVAKALQKPTSSIRVLIIEGTEDFEADIGHANILGTR